MEEIVQACNIQMLYGWGMLGFLGGYLFCMCIATALIFYLDWYLNKEWRELLIDTGNEKAYLDCIKARKKWVV